MKHPVTALRLKEAMEEKGVIAQDLANMTGIHKSSISQYLNGSHAPSIHSAGKMAEVLNVSSAWLKGYDVPMEMPTARGKVTYADIIAKLPDLDLVQLDSLQSAIKDERIGRYLKEIDMLKKKLEEGESK